jgi:hypothetical protein
MLQASQPGASARALTQPGDEEEDEQEGGDADVDSPGDTCQVQYGTGYSHRSSDDERELERHAGRRLDHAESDVVF